MAKQDKENFIKYVNEELNDMSKSMDIVERFDKLKTMEKLDEGDRDYYSWINKRSVSELLYTIIKHEQIFSVSNEKEKQKERGAEPILCNNPDWCIYKITTAEASKYYGKDTKWCISGTRDNCFNSYSKDGREFYFIWKRGYTQTDPPTNKWCIMYFRQKHRASKRSCVISLRDIVAFYSADDYEYGLFTFLNCVPIDVSKQLSFLSPMVDEYAKVSAKSQDIYFKLKQKGLIKGDGIVYDPVYKNCEDDLYMISQIMKIRKLIIPGSIKTLTSDLIGEFYPCVLYITTNEFQSDENNNIDVITQRSNRQYRGHRHYDGCEDDVTLNTIVLENGVKEIGDNAFYNFDIDYITFPSSLVKIGNHAFSYINSKELTIPEGVVTIGDFAFEDASNVSILNLPSTLMEMGTNWFGVPSKSYTKHIPHLGSRIIGEFDAQYAALLNSMNIELNNEYDEDYDDEDDEDDIELYCEEDESGKEKLLTINIRGKYRPEILKNLGTPYHTIINWVDCDDEAQKQVVYDIGDSFMHKLDMLNNINNTKEE